MFQKYSQDEAQALVKALKEGNQLAFSIVYKTYAAQTFSLAFKYLLNKELAEDAVQNLFLKHLLFGECQTALSLLPLHQRIVYFRSCIKHTLAEGE